MITCQLTMYIYWRGGFFLLQQIFLKTVSCLSLGVSFLSVKFQFNSSNIFWGVSIILSVCVVAPWSQYSISFDGCFRRKFLVEVNFMVGWGGVGGSDLHFLCDKSLLAFWQESDGSEDNKQLINPSSSSSNSKSSDDTFIDKLSPGYKRIV